MGSLRIVIVHNRYRSGQPSGEDRVVDQESALLAEAGHEVSRFLRHSDDIAAMSLPAKAALPLQVPWDPAVRRELAARLRETRPDVVHIHSTFPLLSPSVVAACADAGVPAVATLHNYALVCPLGTLYRNGRICTECLGASVRPAVRHGCYRGSHLATLPLAAGVVVNRKRWRTGVSRFFCISGSQRDVLVSAGMPADRMAVHQNIVPDPGLRRSGAGEHVLYIGRLAHEKGLHTLFGAWDRLSEAPLPLVIAGSGPLEDEVARWADHHPDVHFLGLQTRAQCAELLSRAAVVVAPSAWPEPFGLVVVEAMAAGVPTVASAHGAFPELVDDHITGLLHSPGDPVSLAERLTEALRSPERNREMGLAARARYDRDFVPSAGVDRLVAGYRAVMAEAAWPPR